MADNPTTKPAGNIIIKKIKKGGHGHHGGAWKVAYADFVTAMMAFFLLMWLLNATEAEQLAGLADYFTPTIGISGQMGIGFRGGKAAISDGIGADVSTNKGIVFGGVPSGPIIKVTEKSEVPTEIADDEKVIINVGTAGQGGSSSKDKDKDKPKDIESNADQPPEAAPLSDAADQLQDYVRGQQGATMKDAVDIAQSIEGLQIEIKDTSKDSMFKDNTAVLQPRIEQVLVKIAEVIKSLPNFVSITGHATSIPLSEHGGDYTNWELSTDRANVTRRFLIKQGVQNDRFSEVIGKADNEPLDPKHPELPLNSRISILLLKNGVLPNHKQVAPEGIFVNPESPEAQELLGKKPAPKEEKKVTKPDAKLQGVIKEMSHSTMEGESSDPLPPGSKK